MVIDKWKQIWQVGCLIGLLLFGAWIPAIADDKPMVDSAKVERFIIKTNEYTKDNPNPFRWNKQDVLKIVNAFNLNDEEYLEVQKIIAEQVDVDYYSHTPDATDLNGRSKFLVFHLAMHYPLEKWEAQYVTKEALVISKVLPIVLSCSEKMRPQWVYQLGSYVRNIDNHKMPFSLESRNKVSDGLFAIFSSSSNSLPSRVAAVKAWASSERREEKKYEGLNILLKDDDVFEKVGNQFYVLDAPRSPAPKIRERMFQILEKRTQYRDKIVKGAVDSFQNYGWNESEPAQVKKRDRLRTILIKLRDKEKNEELKRRYGAILDTLEATKQEN